MKLHGHAFLMCLLAAATLVADEGTTFFRNPALSATTIVFEYGGDLWTVPRQRRAGGCG